jgi:hypothetical protein
MRAKIRRHLGFLFEEAAKPQKLLVTAAAAGKAAFSFPVEFTPHRYAVFLLHIAAEIEHALMVQYLYAAFSLGGSKVPADRWIEVTEWREIILGIAKEDMGHLMTVMARRSRCDPLGSWLVLREKERVDGHRHHWN